MAEDLPHLDLVADDQDAENKSEHAHHRLQRHHEPALVDAVGYDAAIGAEHQHGQRLQGYRETDVSRGVRQLEDQPRLRDGLHPGPDQRDGLAQ